MIYKGKLIPDWAKMKNYIMEVSLDNCILEKNNLKKEAL